MNPFLRKIFQSKLFLGLMAIPFITLPLIAVNWLINAFLSSIRSLTRHMTFTAPSAFDFRSDRLLLYAALVGISALLYLIFLFRMRTAFRPLKSVNADKGAQRFATPDEIRNQYRAVPEKDDKFSGYGGVPISHFDNKIYIDDTATNTMVIGITRSGKGETFVIPAIDLYSRAENQASIIVNDPKYELAPAAWKPLGKRGYDRYVLNLVDPYQGMGFNPFAMIAAAYKEGNYGEAQLLSRAFSFTLFNDPTAKDKAWQNWAISLSNAIILALCADCKDPEQINPYSAVRFLTRLGMVKTDQKSARTLLDEFFYARPDNDIARLQYAAVDFAPAEKTRPTIFSMFLQKYEIFTYAPIAYMCTHNSLDLKSIGFGKKPVAVFMCTPEFDSSCHFIASLFVQQVNYCLSKAATLSQSHKCDRRVVFHLDEFGNMPAIPNIENGVTMGLGRNIIYNLVTQSFEQLDAVYGDKTAGTIRKNCGNLIFIKTNESSTAADISKQLGNETVVTYSRSGNGFGLNKNVNESVESHPLLDENKIQNLKESESIVIRSMKRHDLKNNRITAFPIINTGATAFPLRWEYLPEFDPKQPRPTIKKQEYDIESRVFFADFEMPTDDAFDIESERLGDILSPREMNIFKRSMPIEADYEYMTYTEFKAFLQDACDASEIDEKKAMGAMQFILNHYKGGDMT